MMEKIDQTLGLRRIFDRRQGDFFFSLGAGASKENMLDYWNWMVGVSIDTSGGVIDVEVRAFDPEARKQSPRRSSRKAQS